MTADNHDFLLDLVTLLREKAAEAKEEAAVGGDYNKGRHFAYYEVLSLVYQQAQVFGIDLESIGMGGFDPEQDIL